MSATFKGGEKMQAKLQEILRAMAPERGRTVRVGFLQGSHCGQNNSASAPEVAFYNEYGTSKTPARPFFRHMITKYSPKWGKLLEACLKHQKFSVQLALAEAGLKMHEQLQQSIEEANVWAEPNAPATIARKGFADPTGPPLQDSKNMKRAVWFDVVGDE